MFMKKFVYLDYVVMMFVDLFVVEDMMKFLILDGVFGNLVFCFYVYGW